MTTHIYTPLLVVPSFTDEGSCRLSKHLIFVINLASVSEKNVMSLPSHSHLYRILLMYNQFAI